MNSDDLAFFCMVVDSGSLAAAAISAGCDASTVSRRISQLEKSVGARLFSRSGRGLVLAPQGRDLLTYARQVAVIIEAARNAVKDTYRQGPDLIHLAAQPTIAKTLFKRLYRPIRTAFPHSRIHFTEAKANKILVDLQAGGFDTAIMYLPEYPGNLSYEPLLFERLCLIAPAGFPLDADTLAVTGLAGIPLILPSTTHGLRVQVQEMMARSGCTPEIVLQSDSSIAVTLDLVADNCGCTVLPLAAAESHVAAGRVVAYPLTGPHTERCIALVGGRSQIGTSDFWRLNGLIREIIAGVVETPAWPGTRRPA